jgi:hypothetical protein
VASAAVAASATTPRTADGQPKDVQELLALFGAPAIPANYTLVIDTSSSMKDGKPPASTAAQKGLATFAKAVPKGDRVTLIFFDESPRTVYRERISGKADRKDLAAKGAAEKFEGQATDIGAALADAQRQITSPTASAIEVQTLLFISDGANNPAPGSPYSALPTNAAWRDLGNTGADIAESHVLNVTGVGVGTKAGVRLLRSAFPPDVVTVVDLPADQLAGVFADVIAQTQLTKIRSSVNGDLQSGIAAELDVERIKEAASGTVTLTNERGKLDSTVAVDGVELALPDGTSISTELEPGAASPVTLAPGESAEYSFVMHPGDLVDTSIALGRPTSSTDVSADVSLTLTTPAAPLLERLYVGNRLAAGDLERSITVSTNDQDAVVRIGVPPWLIALGVLILGLFSAFCVWLYRFWRVPPKLIDKLKYRDAAGKERVIQLRGRTMQVPSPDAVVPKAGRGQVTFFTRPGPRNRSKVFVRRDAAPAKFFDQFGSSPNGVDVMESGMQMGPFDEIKIGESPRLRLEPKGFA